MAFVACPVAVSGLISDFDFALLPGAIWSVSIGLDLADFFFILFEYVVDFLPADASAIRSALVLVNPASVALASDRGWVTSVMLTL